MATAVLALVLLACAALYFMTAEERARLVRLAVATARNAIDKARQPHEPGDPFDDMLRARTGRLVVTPLLVALNVAVFVLMLFGSGSLSDVQTLIDWGGNYAPRATNGEWWRVITSMFVHGGLLHLGATMAGLVSIGVILERAVGRIALATIYFAAGLVASVVALWTMPPMSVSYGASGAVFGTYGLLVASVAWTIISGPTLPVPLQLVKRLGVTALVFVLYNVATDSLGMASELAGLGAGVAGGFIVARGVAREKPAPHRAAWVMAAAAAVIMIAAVPLQGIIDFRPEVTRIAAVEERTAAAYESAVANYRLGRVPAKELIALIDRTIIPELRTVRTRVMALRGVPSEQKPLAGAAAEYFELREASWRRRAEGLLKSNSNILRDAERTERAALDAFRKMKPPTEAGDTAGAPPPAAPPGV